MSFLKSTSKYYMAEDCETHAPKEHWCGAIYSNSTFPPPTRHPRCKFHATGRLLARFYWMKRLLLYPTRLLRNWHAPSAQLARINGQKDRRYYKQLSRLYPNLVFNRLSRRLIKYATKKLPDSEGKLDKIQASSENPEYSFCTYILIINIKVIEINPLSQSCY